MDLIDPNHQDWRQAIHINWFPCFDGNLMDFIWLLKSLAFFSDSQKYLSLSLKALTRSSLKQGIHSMSYCAAIENNWDLHLLTSEDQIDRWKAMVLGGCFYFHVVFPFCLVWESRVGMSSIEYCTNFEIQYIQNNVERDLSTFCWHICSQNLKVPEHPASS